MGKQFKRHAAKVNETLGWDLETIVERRPNEESLFGNRRLWVVSLRPTFNHAGDKFPEEDHGPSHLSPLPNTHTRTDLKSCMEMTRPTLNSPKGPVVVGQPTFEDSFGARACRGCREVVCGCLDEVYFGFQ